MNQPLKGLSSGEIIEWIENYLLTHQAHQFTINGVTYPFVRELHFAAVPYPLQRKYSMLAGLFITRPGDLLFLFQSDPQFDIDINSRRGLRGVYRIVSQPFADSHSITCSTGYEILGKCPYCGTFHSDLSGKCLKCDNDYPPFATPLNSYYHLLVMNLRLDIEPLIVFERAVSDERTYADMSDPGIIWIGRHDNAMGPGKGSSIRQLLREEAVKLVRLFLTEPDQKISFPKKVPYPYSHGVIINEDGTPASWLEVQPRPIAGDIVTHELMLNFHISTTIDQPGSGIQTALQPFLTSQDLEYFSNEFPWGYTAGTSDFVCSLAKQGIRYRLIVMEFKKDWVGDETVIQTSLYVPWVVQTLTQFANPSPRELEVVPVFVGRRLDPDACRPKPYGYRASFNSGVKLDVQVQSPIYIEYKPVRIQKVNSKHYASDLEYLNKSTLLANREILWQPPKGTVTSQVEKDWVKQTSWVLARRQAGL